MRLRPPFSAGGCVCGSMPSNESECRSIRITGRMMIVADSPASRPKRTIRPSSGNLITVPTSRFLCRRPEPDALMRVSGIANN
jgi:hypothetical protein